MDRPIIDIPRFAAPSELPPERVYHVPKRFGIGTIFIFTAMFCVLFGILRYYGAPHAVYLLSIAYVFAVGGAQMLWGEFPRGVSIGAGAILLPIAVVIMILQSESRWWSQMSAIALAIPFAAIGGAFVGYLAGALLGGFFLVSEMLDQHLGFTARKEDVPVEADLIELPKVSWRERREGQN